MARWRRSSAYRGGTQVLVHVERLGLDVVWKPENDLFEAPPESCVSRDDLRRVGHRGTGSHRLLPRFDVHPLTFRNFVFPPRSFLQEILGAFLVRFPGRWIDAGHGAVQSPVGHRAVWIELQTPAKGALRFIEPVRVQERVTLVKPLLDFRNGRGDGKVSCSDPCDLPRPLARPSSKPTP